MAKKYALHLAYYFCFFGRNELLEVPLNQTRQL